MKNRYLKALRCGTPDTIPHHVFLNHPEFITDVTGFDYYNEPLKASLRFNEIYDIDNGGFIKTDDTPIPRSTAGKDGQGGESTDEAFHTVWHKEPPFKDPEDLWNFDPDPWGKDAEKSLEPEFAMKNFRWCFEPETWAARRAKEAEGWNRLETVFPGKFTDGRSFYCTCFMWGICVFGWDVFLMALGMDPDRTGQALQRISEVTVKMYEYFATCDNVSFVGPHDDLCMTEGPVTSPEWYCKYIYPQYEKIFSPVKERGMPVILTSDGDISKLAPDLANVVDGFIFEPSTPADFMFENFGKDKCLCGGIDARVLSFQTDVEVEKHVHDVLENGKMCPGYVALCANTIQSNIPLKNVHAYFNAVEKYRHR